MARIAQSEENRVLTSMRRHCAAKGLKTLSLVYDGMVVLAEGVGEDGLGVYPIRSTLYSRFSPKWSRCGGGCRIFLPADIKKLLVAVCNGSLVEAQY